LLNGFNDTLEDAKELLAFSKLIPCKINILEYNPIESATFERAEDETLEPFLRYLADRGVQVNVRRSRGKDIDAACGQLAIKEK
jgi:23S rRNA (adenine2503-C2)-methyltransferase